MSFSIRHLLGIVGLAALFVGGLTYHTTWWATGIVMLTLAILSASTLGVWLGWLASEFWLPFAFVGWVYLVISFMPANGLRLAERLPSTVLQPRIWKYFAASAPDSAERNNDAIDEPPEIIGSDYELSPSGAAPGTSVLVLNNRLAMPPGYLEHIDIVQCLFTVLFAGLAGACSSFTSRGRLSQKK